MDSLQRDIWAPKQVEAADGMYVAVSGNTGAGKSTLVRELRTRLASRWPVVVAVDERELHHPYLPLMFSQPERFAFTVQLNFLLQRQAILRNWLGAGACVIIERSHMDDLLFVQNHLEWGHIDPGQYRAYVRLADTLHLTIPAPDLVVCIDVKPPVSLERIRKGEQDGSRPIEFPDEVTKARYVHDWFRRYTNFFYELETRAGSPPFLRIDAEDPTTAQVDLIVERLSHDH